MSARRPGRYLQTRILRLAVVVFPASIGAIALSILSVRSKWFLMCAAPLLLALPVLDRLTAPGRRLDPVPWRKGLAGERAVGQMLGELEKLGFVVAHDLQTESGNVDHVVIGPTGVFAIETKHWTGRFWPEKGRVVSSNGRADAAIWQARRGAMQVKDRLKSAGVFAWVEAVVASTKATVSKTTLRSHGVTIVEANHLRTFLAAGRPRMTQADIRRAAGALGVRLSRRGSLRLVRAD